MHLCICNIPLVFPRQLQRYYFFLTEVIHSFDVDSLIECLDKVHFFGAEVIHPLNTPHELSDIWQSLIDVPPGIKIFTSEF